MLLHRFRESLFQPQSPVPAIAGTSTAFVACPLFPPIGSVYHTQTEFLYRLAYEQAQALLSPPRASRVQFSLN
jgi:hypothetical protein